MSERTITVPIKGVSQTLTITEAVAAKRAIIAALAKVEVKCKGCGASVLPFPACPKCGTT